ncbi:condensin complex subunit 1-like isoform X2 [Tachypleus tridentatus]|uniref:condensin complex subunit 1-like isoform X2 n=1 Tax=Tachypleus tridentatus TaxID=6853 RepID=UPI003FD4FBD7
MAHFEFVLPLNFEDLRTSQNTRHYVVDEVVYVRDISNRLQECEQMLRTEGAEGILETFNTYYSVIYHFNKLEPEVRQESLEMIVTTAIKLCGQQSMILEDIEQLDYETRTKQLNLLKMTCYILCQFIEAFEVESLKPTTQTVVTGKRKHTKKRTNQGWDWEVEKEKCLQTLFHLYELPLQRLWDPPVVEEEFVNLVTGCCYKLFENPLIARSKTTKDIIFHLLGISLKKHGHGLACSLKIIQLLQHFEHLASSFAQAIEVFVNSYGVKNILNEIIREIGRMDMNDLARDTSGTRALSQFLVEVVVKVPSVVLPSISLLLAYLDGEAYTMRNCVLNILGEIILKVLSRDDLESKSKDLRDQLLDKLEDHIYDVNAFVRSKVLQIWNQLCTEKAVPLPRQDNLLDLIIGRLHDKASSVRKYAIQFLTAFLQGNPFAAKLTLEELQANYEKEAEKLKMMMPDEPVEESDIGGIEGGLDGKWEVMSKDLLAVIREMSETNNEDNTEEYEEADDSILISEVFRKVHQLLDEGQFRKAISTTRQAMKLFPDHQLFLSVQSQESEEPLTSSFSDSKEEDTKDKDVPDIFKILQSIYLGNQCDSQLAHLEMEDKVVSDVAMETEHAMGNGGNTEHNVVNEVTKQQILVQYLKDSVKFAQKIQIALPIVCQLLGSRTVSDVLEAIDFFVTAFEFGVRDAMSGIQRMLLLVWSKENAVKDAVVNAYRRLYLCPEGGNTRAKAVAVVQNLTALVQTCNLGERMSLEHLLEEFMKSGDLNSTVIQVLWERFSKRGPSVTSQDSHAALVLLGMAAGAEVKIVRSNIDILVSVGLDPEAGGDFQIVRDTCATLLKLTGNTKPSVEAKSPPFKFPKDHEIFVKLSDILVKGLLKLDDKYYVPMVEQAINTIYKLGEHPDLICGDILKQLYQVMLNNPDTDQKESEDAGEQAFNLKLESAMLARFLSVAGHMALQHLVYLDVSVFTEIKRRQFVQEQKNESLIKKRKRQSASGVSEHSKLKDQVLSGEIEEELGLTGAVADDTEAEYVCQVCDKEIVTGGNLLGLIRPLIIAVCSDPVKYKDPHLRSAAALVLAKYMLISHSFCESQLPLLFTIMEKSPEPLIRANTIIALGDLSFRFPNLIEPWTPHLYSRLRDDSVQVRKNTLIVLTHLILNDMVKVKGQISDVALCIVDNKEEVAGLAKLFFHELSKKGNAIYNILPDIISRLSDPECGTNGENFRTILRFLFSFIEKDKQLESLVEKLCHRFRATRTDRQNQDLAFCLSLLPYSERCIHKLQENVTCFADKLNDNAVYESFVCIITATKKGINLKSEVKIILEELEQMIEECHLKGMSEDQLIEKAQKASVSVRPGLKGCKTPHGKRKTVKISQRKKTSSSSSEESDSDEDILKTQSRRTAKRANVISNDENRGKANHSQRRNCRKPPVLEFSSDSSEENSN